MILSHRGENKNYIFDLCKISNIIGERNNEDNKIYNNHRFCSDISKNVCITSDQLYKTSGS